MHQPKILFFDIESSDLAADIGHVLCVGYQWAGEKKVTLLSLLDYPGKTLNDDSKLLAEFAKVYEQADMVVYQFGEYFDLPFLQTRLLVHRLPRLPTSSQVDTWRIARTKLKFGSNRLDRIAEVLGCPYTKTPVKLSHWSDARIGDKTAFKYVLNHCKIDIQVLAWVYYRIRHMWPKHPNVYRVDPLRKCTACGGHGTSHGRIVTEKYTYQRLKCRKCSFSWRGERFPNE